MKGIQEKERERKEWIRKGGKEREIARGEEAKDIKSSD